MRKPLNLLAHPTRFERVAFAFGGQLFDSEALVHVGTIRHLICRDGSRVPSAFCLETAAKLLSSLEAILAIFSKRPLKSLNNQADFDSAIRRFDPSRPSQAVLQFATVYDLRHKAPEIRAFRAIELVSKLPVSTPRG